MTDRTPTTAGLQRYAPDFGGNMLPAEDGRWVRYRPAEPRADGLDVARLAEALHRAVVTGYGESACGGKGGVDDPLVFHLGEARSIAREYAALEEPTE